MTKRLIASLLVAALVLSVMVVPVGATQTQENVTALTEKCTCGCEQPLDQVKWKPYNVNEDSKLAPGHYYLEEDYVQTGAQITIMAGDHVVLDLRGHTLTTSYSGRLYLIYGYLHVLDSVGGGKLMSKTTGSGYGGVIMVSVYEVNDSLFELRSGTVTQDPAGNESLRGGLISLGHTSTFRMTGGVLTGGRTHVNGTSANQGGAVAGTTATSKIEILGGTIMDCYSVTDGGSIYNVGTTILKNCKILGGTAQRNGGNIYQSGGSLTMENCDIAYGTARGDGGGNIYVTGSAVFTDKGSTIRDGYAYGGTGNGGGNILFAVNTNNTLNGTTIRGGVSRKYGANILNWSATTTRLIDCNIDGDVRWAGTGLSLEGKTKIGLRGNGLNLVGGTAGSVISASKLTDGAEIFVSAHYGTFTKDAANIDYFKPALRTVITQNADGTLSGDNAESGAQGGYCPHCYDPKNPQKVTWQTYTASTDANISESGHYYLSKAVTGRLNIMGGADVVIDLNGLNITSGHRALVLKKDAKLSILDFSGAGKVTDSGGDAWPGGVIYCEGASDLNIYGGTMIFKAKADATPARGGVLYAPAGCNINVRGGSLDGSAYNYTGTNNYGGAVCLLKGASTFTMTAGRVIGGTAYRGGSMNFGTGNTVTITGGVISGGTATNGGGNIRTYHTETSGTTQFTMTDCAVIGGTVSGDAALTTDKTFAGGNIQFAYHNAQMSNCYVLGGRVTTVGGYAGNINSGAGTLKINESIVADGYAPKGGNLYFGATTSKATITDCLVTGGETFVPTGGASTDGYGGNVFINNGVITIAGGEISGGQATRVGGNIHNNAGNNTVGNKLVLQDGKQKPLVASGTAATGGNLYLAGVTELNSVEIVAGKATTGNDVYLHNGKNMALTLGAGLTGTIYADAAAALLGEGIYGKPITGVTAGAFSADIVVENVAGQPKALPENGKLVIAGATVVDAEGKETWVVDNAAAVNACGEDAYIKLYTGNDLALTKDLTVDFNGQTVAVSGSGKLSGMDSTGDGYGLPKGKATGTVNAADITYAPNGNTYLPVEENGEVTFHRLGMAITDVALRPSEAGLYYKAAFSGDSVVKGLIKEYGIATSLEETPSADFKNDPNCDSLWVGFTGEITNGAKQCGVVVKNILKQSNTNAGNNENGRMSVFATAYVTLTDGTTYMARDNIAYSLYDFMEQLDDLIQTDPGNYRRLEKRTKEFYAAWEDKGLADWKFNRLQAPVDPRTDDEFNVLMVASSGCYYFVEELYELLAEAGYKNVRVCNLYYSGCRLQWHYEWWRDNKENYQFFVTDETGRHKTEGVGLEYCLSQYNWDVIGLIEGTSYMKTASPDSPTHYEKTKGYLDALTTYFKAEFPQAKHVWHQTWSYQVGWDGNGYKVTSLADQKADYTRYREYAQMVCDGFDLEWINCGDGWEVYRDLANSNATDDIVDDLCARIGKASGDDPHAGDNSHDGDIGGGQLMNACVWFERITGKDCRELKYVPEYKSGSTVIPNRFDAAVIKQSAHTAVQALNK